MTSPVEGLIVLKVLPDFDLCHSLLMNTFNTTELMLRKTLEPAFKKAVY
jgi:hypothetical protein